MPDLHPALSDRHRFCGIVESARHHKLPGHWSGSAFRSHPCGVYREGLLFADHWHVDDSGHIAAATDPTAKLILGCQDSCAYGNPYPKPSTGEFIEVWRNGHWAVYGPWQEKASRILYDLEAEIAEAKEKERQERVMADEIKRQAQEEKLAALRVAHGASL